MIIDAHLHCSGRERTEDVLHSLDDAGVDVAVLLAPFLSEGFSLHDREQLLHASALLGELVAGHEDRLVGFAVVNPVLPLACEDLRRAVESHGLRGLKMVPSGWYPDDERAHGIYALAAEYRLPILFHSGIFIDGRSGKYCRPVLFEALRDHPGLHVTLAHLGWPWCDEAIAVGLIDLINGVPADTCMFRFDLSFGAPPIYRERVLRDALDVLTPSLLQFGSDRFLPCEGAHIRTAIDEVRELLECIGVDHRGRSRIFSGTAAKWLGIDDGVDA